MISLFRVSLVDLFELRQEYTQQQLDMDHVMEDPYQQFERWYREAEKAELLEPNAMVLGTVGPDQRPAQRTVLLKSFDEQGFVFFTNYKSRKAKHLESNGRVSLLFQWLPLQRQVEISGVAARVSKSETEKYFLSRPHESQLGAWVSRQSEVVAARSDLDRRLKELKDQFKVGEVPVPDFWGGYRVRAERFEFWQGRASRLHDRIEYQQQSSGGASASWRKCRLSP
ncbi:MAG: pyridoxamine 5'-phosphate oxidase [Rubripirellula sp.]